MKVGVAYGSDTSRVRGLLCELAARHPRAIETRPPEVYFRDFADSALAFELCVWLDDPRHEAIRDERPALRDRGGLPREAGIEIPFRSATIHLKREPVGPRVRSR